MATVLVIEDTSSELNLICNYLRESGYAAVGVGDSATALKQVTQQKPDIVVTDIVMPGMSGLELLRNFKKDPQMSSVPIVVCSSKDQKIDRMWAMKQGASAYITKPFTKEELVSAVRSVAS